jgi:hypothetical protein
VILFKEFIHHKFFYIIYCTSLSYVYSSVTEVVWEGEETEAKKADTDTAKKADTVTIKKADTVAKKADNNGSTNAVKRLMLLLTLSF